MHLVDGAKYVLDERFDELLRPSGTTARDLVVARHRLYGGVAEIAAARRTAICDRTAGAADRDGDPPGPADRRTPPPPTPQD